MEQKGPNVIYWRKRKMDTEETQEVMSMDEKDAVEMLEGMRSISQLLDKFLFGSKKEQMMFESLCHKWTINHFDKMEKSKFYFSDIFIIQEYNFQAQLKLKQHANEMVNFSFCFKDKDGERKKMESKQPPVITMILKDCSGRTDKKHVLNYEHYFVTDANPFYSSDNWTQITKDKLNELISPTTKSIEVLFMVNPPTVFGKLQSTNGTLTDIIPYFEEKLQMEHMFSHGHWSPLFMTHPNGHRVIVKFCLKRNENDDQLQLEALIHFFPYGDLPDDINRMTIILSHPMNIYPKNITIPIRLNRAGVKNINIGKIHHIEERGLISNNSLNYRVNTQLTK